MSDDDYEVGYGRPPKHGQFRKGQSGNPKGRKKGARGLKTDLKAELGERLAITENGKTKKLTKQQAMIKQLTAKALGGDMRAVRILTDLVLTLLGPDDEQVVTRKSLSADDDAILRNFLNRQQGGSNHA